MALANQCSGAVAFVLIVVAFLFSSQCGDGGETSTPSPDSDLASDSTASDADALDDPSSDSPVGADVGDDTTLADIGIDAVDDASTVGGTGAIGGIVLSPNGSGFDVVPGAYVWIDDGPVTVADETGQFLLEDVDAGVPLFVHVEGPRAIDPDHPEIYGTNQVLVTVLRDDVLSLFPHLMPACLGQVDGAGGGTLTRDACAGAGGATLTFGPDSIATLAGDLFSGPVRVEMAVIDPAAITDQSTLPAGAGDAELRTLGAAEIRLFAASTEEPLQIADGSTATVRFEIAEPPAGEEDEVGVDWYDQEAGAWVTQGAGTVVADGDRHFLELDAEHFSNHRARVGRVDSVRDYCLTMTPRLCPPLESCRREAVTYEIWDATNGYRESGSLNWEKTCIRVASTNSVQLELRRLYQGLIYRLPRRTIPIGTGTAELTCCDPSRQSSPACASACQDLGEVDLWPRDSGCLAGTLLVGSEPMAGDVAVSLDGDRVATITEESRDASGNFCAYVPVGLELEFGDLLGNVLTFSPEETASGKLCLDPSANCQQSLPAAVCVESGGCISAEFDHEVTDESVNCPDIRPFELALDASPSEGPIENYQWEVHRIETDEGNETYAYVTSSNGGDSVIQVSVCLRTGRYRVRLKVGRSRRGLSFYYAGQERIVRVGRQFYPGPCTATGEVDGDATYTYTYTYTYTSNDPDTARLETVDQAYSSERLTHRYIYHYEVDPEGSAPIGALLEQEVDFLDDGIDWSRTFTYDGYGYLASVTHWRGSAVWWVGTCRYGGRGSQGEPQSCDFERCLAEDASACEGETPTVEPETIHHDVYTYTSSAIPQLGSRLHDTGVLVTRTTLGHAAVAPERALLDRLACMMSLELLDTQPRPWPLETEVVDYEDDGTPDLERTYEYDLAGNLTRMTAEYASPPSTQILTFDYGCWQ